MPHSCRLRKGRVSSAGQYYAITICCKSKAAVFNNLSVNQVVIREIYQLEQENCIKLIAYTLMPDHLHLLFQLMDMCSLSNVIRSLKGRTATKLRAMNIRKLWQKDFYDTCILHDTMLRNQARYIVANPLRARLVKQIGDYPYWNCIYLSKGIEDL
ncbi:MULTISPECIES: REP-associated tyrosine transposase [unclassified Pseudoalteromonas]|uniref:REP-associated tyrosine transposase n=1 Tax=unclassified Pseudoalteromonas TaxID=194690 RepID=UPI0030150C34